TETSATPETTFDYFGWRVGSSNFAASVTFKNLSVTLGLTPPVITTQPVGVTTIEGNNVVLTAAASGIAPITFQWSKNEVPIAWATSASITLNNARVADSGVYVFTATNPVGIVASNAAAVIVNLAPPVITKQPRSQTILVGEPVNFTVAVNGSAPFTYQWRKNGVNIAAARAQTSGTASPDPTGAGVRPVRVDNDLISVDSNPPPLLVPPPPVPPPSAEQPMPTTVGAGAPP